MIVPIVSESEWKSLLKAAPSWQPAAKHVLVVAPHPDDETLGAGGLIAALRLRRISVTVVAVTDGENAYAEMPNLGQVREREQTEALSRLGVDPKRIFRLRLPDSGLADCEQVLVERLLRVVSGEMHLLAPWSKDFHPDHEVCGRAAKIVSETKRVPLTSYFIWAWHRGTTQLMKGMKLVSFPLGQEEFRAKQDALACHRSQLEHPSGLPILPEYLLEPARRSFEVFLRT
jgi:LmbE family N-acetylglucosaminyl deacetylase